MLKKIIQSCFLRLFILLFCLILPFILYSQGESEPAPDFTGLTSLKFERISTGEGLSNTAVNTIFQDSKGYMWFGTDSGLDKFDGYYFTNYRHNPKNPHSLRYNIIESIYEDRDGILWIGTLGGWLEKYNRQQDGFSHYKISSHIYSMVDDNEGNMWIGSLDPGLLNFDRKTGEVKLIRRGRGFTSILRDQTGVIWWGNREGLLGRYDGRGNRLNLTKLNHPISSIYEDSKGRLWIGTYEGGLLHYHQDSGLHTAFKHDPADPHSISNDNVSSIKEDPMGKLWVGTDGGGLNRFDPISKKFTRFINDPCDVKSLSNNLVISLYIDRTGVLWIGTYTGGLNKIQVSGRKRFQHYQHIPNNPNSLSYNLINAICQDRQGILWIGTTRGMDRFDRQQGIWKAYRHNPRDPNSLNQGGVWSIYRDRKGFLWIGTGSGLDRYVPAKDHFVHYPVSRPNAMMEDSSGKFWIAADKGLYRFTQDAEKPFVFVRSGYAWKITIVEDSRKLLWLGASGDGVERYNPKTGKWDQFKPDPNDTASLSHGFVEDILEDRSGNLWLATGDGLNRFNRETGNFTHLRIEDGLAHNAVKGILEDSAGILWISTEGGLSRFDPGQGTFQNYYPGDGIQDKQFRRNAFYKNTNGEMFFGGINGFNAFFPGQIRNNPNIPPVVITTFSLFDQIVKRDLPDDYSITLSYQENFLSFDFSSLDFTAPGKNQYAFQMEGIDSTWVQAGTRRHADYPDLKPGEYIFRVKATNNDGLWNEKGALVKISITPPFWQTLWFKILMGFFLLLLAFTLYTIRVNRIKKTKKVLEIQVREKTRATEALKNALNEVEQLKNRLHAENIYLQNEIKVDHNFANIISQSKVLKKALMQVEQVAATNATVLILGESGTGKELVARAVHHISERKERPLVKVDCASLPANLIESELFGHEKGAFTGAISKKIGRFELADGGTIFLDEIGELTPDLQMKLLRVLQEGEFERLGNPQTIKIDVRIIAATNRNLKNEVEKGTFREDLFYRLNVFPIKIPPLRDRKEDIPLLVKHFVGKYGKKIGKNIEHISQNYIDTLQDYDWPGNVRELENIVERSVIVSPAKKLILDDWNPAHSKPDQNAPIPTLEEQEKKLITMALEKTGWRVSGEKGAAKILGINPHTLISRMKKLGIQRPGT